MANTIKINVNLAYGSLSIFFSYKSKEDITVKWKDGETKVYDATGEFSLPSKRISYNYGNASVNKHEITITGNITFLHFDIGQDIIMSVDVSANSVLKELRLQQTRTMNNLIFGANNTELIYVDCSSCDSLVNLNVSVLNKLQNFYCNNNNRMSDEMINDLFRSLNNTPLSQLVGLFGQPATEKYIVVSSSTCNTGLATDKGWTVKTNNGTYLPTIPLVTNVILSKTELSLKTGNSETITASFIPDGAVKKVTWKTTSLTAPANAASIAKSDDTSCTIQANTAGKVTLTATAADGSGATASCTVTVTTSTVAVTAVTIEPSPLELDCGKSGTLTAIITPSTATNQEVTWKIVDTDVATYEKDKNDSKKCTVTANATKSGSTKITATADGKTSAEHVIRVKNRVENIAITPATTSPIILNEKEKLTLTATLTPNDGMNNTKSTWAIPEAGKKFVDISVIQGPKIYESGGVSSLGMNQSRCEITGKAPGKTSITVTSDDVPGVYQKFDIHVESSTKIKITNSFMQLATGNEGSFEVEKSPLDAVVIWTSSNKRIASFPNQHIGTISANKAGTAEVTATIKNTTVSATGKVKVVPATTTLAELMRSETLKKDIQKTLHEKLSKVESEAKKLVGYDLDTNGYDLLKKMIQNRSLDESDRIYRNEVEVAKEYYADSTSGIWNKWNKEYNLNAFPWFKNIVGKLLTLFTAQQETGSSLIPIKGISKITQAKLKDYPIYDVGDLLAKGQKISQRNKIARFLDINVRLVDAWVKQADLWRVDGMTTDMAYLLVQIGVRHCDDLSNIDPEKAYSIMERLVLSQPDFYLPSLDKLKEIIANAKSFAYHICVNEAEASAAIADKISELKSGNTLDKDDILKILENNKLKHVKSPPIETWEPAPVYLFAYDAILPVLKTNGQVIREGLDFLNNVPMVLPLPTSISGQIFWRDMYHSDDNKIPYGNVLVEISGISTSSGDKTEKEKIPSAHADSLGKFRISLPEKINLQEGITIKVSKDSWKQTFTRSASDIINAVPEQRILEHFRKLQEIQYLIAYEEKKPERLDALESDKMMVENAITILEQKKEAKEYTAVHRQQMADWIEEKSRIQREIQYLKAEIPNSQKEISRLEEEYEAVRILITSDPRLKNFSNDLEIIFQNLVSSENKYEAKLGKNKDNPDGEDFVLIEQIFKGYDVTLRKALPSVKLMGNDDEAIHLPTDTAPSRVFNYNMLQRLVEPALGPGGISRRILNNPVDVMSFKQQLYTNPDNYPQMSSLGIGYTLNMHQAWVPDGFALGTLLYSLVLAPGEEQRLVVRESKQAYTVADDAIGTDSDQQAYELSQTDDATAAYNYALNQLTKGNSNYNYDAHTDSFGGGYGGAAGFNWGNFLNLGSSHSFSGATSNARGSGSASASQSNAHNEASNAAQMFQHSIKSASNRISQSKRISMRTATSDERDSVATKIIANHNHSHTMTIQYWEVMRRFRLETCIDGIDLVLFVPLRLIRFIPDGNFTPSLSNFNRDMFTKRYDVLLKYADDLMNALPYKYRLGLNLIKKYAALPDWKMENITVGTRALIVKFNCDLMTFDDLTVSLTLKNNKGIIAGVAKYNRRELPVNIETRKDLEKEIRDIRNGKQEKTWIWETSANGLPFPKLKNIDNSEVICTFMIPDSISNDDLSHLTLNYSCEGLEYTLYQNPIRLTDIQKELWKKGLEMLNPANALNPEKVIDFIFGNNKKDQTAQLPEAFRTPNVSLSTQTVINLGEPLISGVTIEVNEANKGLSLMSSSSTLTSSVTMTFANSLPVLRYAELQQMEATMHHIASDTLHYSQVIWAALSNDELAMMLEQYTIDMDFGKLTDVVEKPEDEMTEKEKAEEEARKATEAINIPLLNCVNVKKMLGFYGNCVLLPFTYPKELAKKLGKSAADIQDALYRYHTHCFRVPTTVISLPTEGMVGEAVLGETNVSEEIDLTRFWNWKDSPIDKMEITPNFLNNTDYLADKTAPTISALQVQGADAPAAVTVPDLIAALVAKQTPQFNDITGLNQLKDLLIEGTKSAASGRKEVLDTSVKLAEQAVKVLEINKGKAATSKEVQEVKGQVQEVQGGVKEVKGQVQDVQGTVKEVKGQVEKVQGNVQEVKGQVEAVQGNVQGVQGEIQEVKGQVQEVQGNVQEVQGQMQEVQGQVQEVQGQVQEVQGQVQNIQGGDEIILNDEKWKEQKRKEWRPIFDKLNALLDKNGQISFFEKETGILVISGKDYPAYNANNIFMPDLKLQKISTSIKSSADWEYIERGIHKITDETRERYGNRVDVWRDRETNILVGRKENNDSNTSFWRRIWWKTLNDEEFKVEYQKEWSPVFDEINKIVVQNGQIPLFARESGCLVLTAKDYTFDSGKEKIILPEKLIQVSNVHDWIFLSLYVEFLFLEMFYRIGKYLAVKDKREGGTGVLVVPKESLDPDTWKIFEDIADNKKDGSTIAGINVENFDSFLV